MDEFWLTGTWPKDDIIQKLPDMLLHSSASTGTLWSAKDDMTLYRAMKFRGMRYYDAASLFPERQSAEVDARWEAIHKAHKKTGRRPQDRDTRAYFPLRDMLEEQNAMGIAPAITETATNLDLLRPWTDEHEMAIVAGRAADEAWSSIAKRLARDTQSCMQRWATLQRERFSKSTISGKTGTDPLAVHFDTRAGSNATSSSPQLLSVTIENIGEGSNRPGEQSAAYGEEKAIRALQTSGQRIFNGLVASLDPSTTLIAVYLGLVPADHQYTAKEPAMPIGARRESVMLPPALLEQHFARSDSRRNQILLQNLEWPRVSDQSPPTLSTKSSIQSISNMIAVTALTPPTLKKTNNTDEMSSTSHLMNTGSALTPPASAETTDDRSHNMQTTVTTVRRSQSARVSRARSEPRKLTTSPNSFDLEHLRSPVAHAIVTTRQKRRRQRVFSPGSSPVAKRRKSYSNSSSTHSVVGGAVIGNTKEEMHTQKRSLHAERRAILQPPLQNSAHKFSRHTHVSQTTQIARAEQAPQAPQATGPTEASQATPFSRPRQVSQAIQVSRPKQVSRATQVSHPRQISRATQVSRIRQTSKGTQTIDPPKQKRAIGDAAAAVLNERISDFLKTMFRVIKHQSSQKKCPYCLETKDTVWSKFRQEWKVHLTAHFPSPKQCEECDFLGLDLYELEKHGGVEHPGQEPQIPENTITNHLEPKKHNPPGHPAQEPQKPEKEDIRHFNGRGAQPDSDRPEITSKELVAAALRKKPEGMVIREICKAIAEVHPYYRGGDDSCRDGLRRNVSAVLSKTDLFYQPLKGRGQWGKKWCINPEVDDKESQSSDVYGG